MTHKMQVAIVDDIDKEKMSFVKARYMIDPSNFRFLCTRRYRMEQAKRELKENLTRGMKYL